MRYAVLKYWNREWQMVKLNIDNGKGKVQWIPRRRQNATGWAFKYWFKWYCIRFDMGNLIIQIGAKKWLLNKDVQLLNTKSDDNQHREFIIKVGTETAFRKKYHNFRHHFWNKFDSSFDKLDEESCDFFLYVYNISIDDEMKKNLKNLWSQRHYEQIDYCSID